MEALKTGIEEEEASSQEDAKNVINLSNFIETPSKRGKNLFDLTKFQQSQPRKRPKRNKEKSLFVLNSVDCFNNLYNRFCHNYHPSRFFQVTFASLQALMQELPTLKK